MLKITCQSWKQGWDCYGMGLDMGWDYGANRNHCVHEQKSSLRSGIINGTSLEWKLPQEKIREEQIGRCGQKLDETPTELHIDFLIDQLISLQDPGVDICATWKKVLVATDWTGIRNWMKRLQNSTLFSWSLDKCSGSGSGHLRSETGGHTSWNSWVDTSSQNVRILMRNQCLSSGSGYSIKIKLHRNFSDKDPGTGRIWLGHPRNSPTYSLADWSRSGS